MRKLLFCFFLSGIIYSCKPPGGSLNVNNLVGKWKFVKMISLDQNNIEKADINKCIGKYIYIFKDSIIVEEKCLPQDNCYTPNYKFQKVNTKSFFENDTSYISLLGFHTDSIYVVSTSCNSAYFSYIKFINQDTITITADNKAYIFSKENIK